MRPAIRHGVVSSVLLLPTTLILGIAFQQIGLPLPGLVSLALTLVSYGGYVVFTREYRLGYLAAYATIATISADVPILDNLSAFAGPSVGSIFLIEIVALPAIVYLIYNWGSWDHVEILLTGYSVWAAVTVAIGLGPAKIAGLWFAAYSLMALISYALFRRSVQRGIVSKIDAVYLFLLAAAGQGVIAVLQFIHGSNFGFTTVGEGPNSTGVAIIVFGKQFPIGTYISGFMSMSFELANYLVLLLPIIVVLAILRRRERRVAVGFGCAGIVAVVGIRLTMSDAARGAALIALSILTISLLAARIDIRSLVAAVVPMAPAFIRSTTSGKGAKIDNATLKSSNSNTSTSNHTGTASEAAIDTPTEAAIDTSINISVPFFDLSNLGVRLQQYVVGIQIFLNYPLVGVGAANYQTIAKGYNAPFPPSGEFPYPAHSVYITLLAETGLPGFTLYGLASIAVVFTGLYYGVRKREHLTIGISCGLLGTFAFGAFDILQLYYPTAFIPIWALAGIVAGTYSGIQLQPGISKNILRKFTH